MKKNFEFSLVQGTVEAVIVNNGDKFISRLAGYAALAASRFICSEEQAAELALYKLENELYESVSSNPGAYVRGTRLFGGILAPIAKDIIEIRENGLDELWQAMSVVWRLKKISNKAKFIGDYSIARHNKATLVALMKLARAEALAMGADQALYECFKNFEGDVSEANSLKALDGVIGDFDPEEVDDYIGYALEYAFEEGVYPENDDADAYNVHIGRCLNIQRFLEKKIDGFSIYDSWNRDFYSKELADVRAFVKNNLPELLGKKEYAKEEALRALHSFDNQTTVDEAALAEALENAAEFKDEEKSEEQIQVEAMREAVIGSAPVTVEKVVKVFKPAGDGVTEVKAMPESSGKFYKKNYKTPKFVCRIETETKSVSADEFSAMAAEFRASEKRQAAVDKAYFEAELKKAENELLIRQKQFNEGHCSVKTFQEAVGNAAKARKALARYLATGKRNIVEF